MLQIMGKRGWAWTAKALLAFGLGGLLAGCGYGPTGLEYEETLSQLVIDAPMTEMAPDADVRKLRDYVWAMDGYRVWFETEGDKNVGHLVDRDGLIPLEKFVKRIDFDPGKEVPEEYRRVNRSVVSVRLPTAPFDLISVGEDMVIQARYGKLTIVQYLDLEPGLRRAGLRTEIKTEKWLALADEQSGSLGQRLRHALGMSTFKIVPDLVSRAGFSASAFGTPQAEVRFEGGGQELLELLQQHGASLFDPGEKARNFVRTTLAKPAGVNDMTAIDALAADIRRAEALAEEQAKQEEDAPPPPPESETEGASPADPDAQDTQPSAAAEGGDDRSIQRVTPPGRGYFEGRAPDGKTQAQDNTTQTAAGEMAAWARNFATVPGWGLDIANSPVIRCKASKRVQVGDNASANLLASVAQSQAIAVFVHGLNFFSDSGRPGLAELEADWAAHIATLRASSPSHAYCLVAWDTLKGMTPDQTQLAYLLFALRTLADQPGVYDPARTLTVVGHSAGGLYAKHAYVQFADTRAGEQRYTPLEGNRQTRLRIVTLGTPHQGAGFASNANMLAAMFPALNKMAHVAISDAEAAVLNAAIKAKARSPGMEQLRAIDGNPFLKKLNQQFAQGFNANEFASVASKNDEVIKPEEAISTFGKNFTISGLDHEALLKSPDNALRQWLSRAYRGLAL
jgi:hypothetical protein